MKVNIDIKYINKQTCMFCVSEIDNKKCFSIDRIVYDIFYKYIFVDYSYSIPSTTNDGRLYYQLYTNTLRVDKQKFDIIKIRCIKDFIHNYNSKLDKKCY